MSERTKHAMVSLHRLTADSVGSAYHKPDDGGRVAIVLRDSTQLHWDTLEDFERFMDAACAAVWEQVAISEGGAA